MMYEGGHGVKKDSTQAVQWYRKAADLGFGKAQFNLALMGELVHSSYNFIMSEENSISECQRKRKL